VKKYLPLFALAAAVWFVFLRRKKATPAKAAAPYGTPYSTGGSTGAQMALPGGGAARSSGFSEPATGAGTLDKVLGAVGAVAGLVKGSGIFAGSSKQPTVGTETRGLDSGGGGWAEAPTWKEGKYLEGPAVQSELWNPDKDFADDPGLESPDAVAEDISAWGDSGSDFDWGGSGWDDWVGGEMSGELGGGGDSGFGPDLEFEFGGGWL
jgi:hypothetical protein